MTTILPTYTLKGSGVSAVIESPEIHLRWLLFGIYFLSLGIWGLLSIYTRRKIHQFLSQGSPVSEPVLALFQESQVRAGLKTKFTLLEIPNLPSQVLFDLLNPRILLPAQALDDSLQFTNYFPVSSPGLASQRPAYPSHGRSL